MESRRFPLCVGLLQTLILLVNEVKSTLPLDPCPNDSTNSFLFNGFCYTMETNKKDWNKAQLNCVRNQGHLVSIHSDSESNFLTTMLKYRNIQDDRVWIGLAEIPGRSLEWADDSLVNYVNWDKNQPSNSSSRKCISVIPQTGKWVEASCDSNLNFICTVRFETTLPPPPTTSSPKNDGHCSLGWFSFGNKCFLPMTNDNGAAKQDTWHGAVASCAAIEAHLVSIHSAEEQKTLTNIIQNVLKENAWIGLHDTITESEFEWIDGTELDFTLWAPNEPFGAFHTSDCVELWHEREHMGQWRDYSCDISKAYICQKKKGANGFTDFPTPNLQPTTLKSRANGFTDFPTPNLQPTTQNPLVRCRESEGWLLFDNNCYKVESTMLSFKAAEKQCRRNSGHLVSIHSQRENDFIKRLTNKFFAPMIKLGISTIWIGLSTQTWDDKPRWSDGSTLTYSNWDTNEPRSILWNAKCSNISISSGKWGEETCSNLKLFVCKRPYEQRQPQVSTGCSPGWYPFGNKCFLPIGEESRDLTSWHRAVENCAALGSHLASVHSAEEQAMLNSLLLSLGHESWIGLHDTMNETTFVWMDDTNVDFTFWAPHEPMGVLQTSDCVEMWYRGGNFGQWRDFSCGANKAYICQKYKGPKPTLPNKDDGFCPLGFQQWQYNGRKKCYSIETENLVTWQEAEFQCYEKGGSLVSIHSAFEMAVVSMFMNEIQTSIWIGLSRNNYGLFYWSDNSSVEFSNWEGNEPSTEGCVEMNQKTLTWAAVSCSLLRGYICVTDKAANNSITIAERQRGEDTLPQEKSSGLPEGGVGAIVVVCLLVVVCLVAVSVFFLSRKTRFRSLIPTSHPEPMCFNNVLFDKDRQEKSIDLPF